MNLPPSVDVNINFHFCHIFELYWQNENEDNQNELIVYSDNVLAN